MVAFEFTMGGFAVKVDGKLFGHLQQGDGFFTDPTVVREFMAVSPDDLHFIARKAKEVKVHGHAIPICTSCKGTPEFPRTIYSPNEGEILCSHSMHSDARRG